MKKSQAVRLLRAKFENGEIKGDEQPKAVWESDAAFQKHKLPNFRTCYNSMRLEFGHKGGTDIPFHFPLRDFTPRQLTLECSCRGDR